MKKTLLHATGLILFFLLTISLNQASAQCSVAGTATSTTDSICVDGNANLLLTGFVGAVQWQSYNGSVWIDEVGVGATTANYNVSPPATTDYRAIVAEVSCTPDTSNIKTITVGPGISATAGATRCGYGPVTLSATGSGIRWYDVPTGGSSVGTGNTFTTNVSSTTTFYASSTIGGGAPTPLTTTFAGGNGFDGNMFDITALNTVTIDSFAANFNVGSGVAEIWYRPGTHVGFTGSNAGWTQAGTANYTSTGNGSPGTSINIYVNVTIPAGQTYAFYVHGSLGITYTNGTAVGNIYTQDANILVGEGFGGAYFNLVNSPRVFNGRIMYSAGCESNRLPVVATVNTAPSFTISANPNALCQGQSSAISVSSSNASYNYTWSPATGLSATTGTSVTATPLSPITYTVVADDGTCGYIDSVSISVGPASVAGTAIISTDTICLGDIATLFLSGYTGNIQWQRFDGTNWVNETGTGNTSAQYVVTPIVNSTYRAVVTSGGCSPAISTSLNVEVLAITDPVTTNDTICGPGVVNLSAAGAGILNWYTSATGGTSVNTGATYSPNINTSTTYYVEASAGANYLLGIPNLLPISQFTVGGNDWGIQFDVLSQSTLQSVSIYPGSVSGNVTINLRATQGGAILNTVTIPVFAGTGPVPVNLGFTLNPGVGYRLELATGSVPCFYNSFGAAYPYTSPGSPVTLTGLINPTFSTGAFYYFFYNWVVKEGCSSNRVVVDGIVLSNPPVPTINVQWNTFTSSSATGNQWYLNGVLIPGATDQIYVATQAGTYTVVVTNTNGCSSQSLPVFTTSVEQVNDLEGISVYPNPVKDKLYFEMNNTHSSEITLTIYNVIGKVVATHFINGNTHHIDFNYPAGDYLLEFYMNGQYLRKAIIKN